jgi:mannose-1-phosphate guanylyltransferase
MRAILLAAGLGTRLKPLTLDTPKCLVMINGQPLLDIWLRKLVFAGVEPFLVNTYHLSDKVRNYFNESEYRDKIYESNEPSLLGTAGTLIKNKEFFCSEDGLLIHADNYCGDDLVSFIQAHKDRPPECLMTMMAFRTDSPSSCGIVKVNERGVVVGFHEKVKCPPGNLANGAIYILSKELIKYISINMSMAKDFSNEILPSLLGKIFVYETKEVFIDIGTPETYKLANEIHKSN